MSRGLYLIAYDITEDDRLNRVRHLLKGYSTGGQKSVYECFLSPPEVREIASIGLDPFIGFYHQFDYGRESFACDIVEPYRPCVDRWVWELFRKRTFTGRDFNEGDERPGCYLKKEGRSRYYVLYEEWADGIRKMIRDEVQLLSRRIMDGQDIIPEREQGDDGSEGWSFAMDNDGE